MLNVGVRNNLATSFKRMDENHKPKNFLTYQLKYDNSSW